MASRSAKWWPNLAIFVFLVATMGFGLIMRTVVPPDKPTPPSEERTELRLPLPQTTGGMSLVEALAQPPSRGDFADQPLTLEQLSQLCWATQSFGEEMRGSLTALFATEQCVLTIFVINRDGVHEYDAKEHALRSSPHELREMPTVPLGQTAAASAPAYLVITMRAGVRARTFQRGGERDCLLRAAHMAQNVLLQATALGLMAVPVASFDEQRIAKTFNTPPNLRPIYFVALGYAREREQYQACPQPFLTDE